MSNPQQQNESIERLDRLLTPLRREAVAKVVSGASDAFAVIGMVSPLTRRDISEGQILRSMETGPRALEAGMSAIGLEAIVRVTGRPPFVVRNGEVEVLPELLSDLPNDTALLIRAAAPMVSSVGRIEFINHPSMGWGGTGWVIGETKEQDGCLVVTNRHVAVLVAQRSQDGRGIFARASTTGARLGCRVDFNEEVHADMASAREVRVTEVVYLADDLAADVALLKIRIADAPWALPDPIPLAAQEAEHDELVALIGYPARDSRNDATAMERYFQGLYEVKRFAPGKITQTAAQGIISHDCTSLGGNSGSPVISLRQRAAVGLHFAGVYGVGNSAVGVKTLKALLHDPSAVSVSGALFAAGATEAPADGTHHPDQLSNRGGFDDGFLAAGLPHTPWPVLSPEVTTTLARPSDARTDRPHELRYTHFGVLFSEAHKLPLITAVNIDGAAAVRIKRENDKWWFDGRIPLDLQHGAKAYADRAIDRGHMVRREDPNWGNQAMQANDDTFHYTNSAPQHALLNQGRAMWLGLEEHILGSARTHGFKANVFTGPIFDDDDPMFEEGMRVPLEFWKVVVMPSTDHDRLHATAYMLSQGQLIRKLLEDRGRSEATEGFVFGAYRTFQITIADLERGTGYDFGQLRACDPLAIRSAATAAAQEGAPSYLPLESFSDLLL
jgi:endonuclease G